MSDVVSLLPPNSTDTERAIECATARLADVPVPLRSLWDPATCPANLLPWLAWALSVDEWDPLWSESQKREVVTQAAAVHRAKGTAGAVKRAVGALGYGTTVMEWFETGHDPHTFTIYVDNQGDAMTAGLEESIRRVVAATKPVRSHLLDVIMMTSTTPQSHILAATVVGDIVTVYPEA